MTAPASAHRAAPHVAWRRVGEEVVLLDLRRRKYFTLNASGAQVWSLLVRGMTEDAAAEDLAERHDHPLRSVRRDVSALAARLRREGLLVLR